MTTENTQIHPFTVTIPGETLEDLQDRLARGVAVFRDDFQTIRPLAERDNANVVHWIEHERGGHYAVLEVPELVVADLRVFFAAN